MIQIQKGLAFYFGMIIICHCAQAQFNDKTLSLGLDKSTVSQSLMGGGAAFVDYDNDGLLDLYLVGGDDPDYLFRNTGQNSYENVSSEAFIAQVTGGYNTTAVTAGDVNNDGCIDLFVTSFSKLKSSLLFLNDCSGGFINTTEASGIGSVTSSSTGSAFFDVNLDGYLDIYVINYIDKRQFIYNESGEISGFDHVCFPNHLFVNNGDDSFTEMSETFGVSDIGCGLAVLPTDYDQDGDQDLLIANDFGAWVQSNRLLENNYPDDSFTDVSVSAGMDVGIYGMGIASGDYDNDGDLDYYITNLGRNILMENNGDNTFTDVADILNVGNENNNDGTSTTGWGCFFFDYDNDSNLDLYVVNGYIPASPFLNTTENDVNVLFRYDEGEFSNVTSEYGLANEEINRGAIYGDYDNDGTLDVFAIATSIDGSGVSSFYENTFSANNWIEIKLEGTVTNRDAYGTWAYLYLGERTFVKELSCGGSHASQHSPVLHFGLGSVVDVDSIEIIWPLGEKQIVREILANQRIQIVEGTEGYDILGCLDSGYDNFNPNATIASGCITSKVAGCTNPLGENFNPLAEIDDGSCEVVTGSGEFASPGPHIYPLPFRSRLHVQLPDNGTNYGLVMNDLQGNLIQVDIQQLDCAITIDTRHLPQGIYLFRIIDVDSNTVHSKKLIKR